MMVRRSLGGAERVPMLMGGRRFCVACLRVVSCMAAMLFGMACIPAFGEAYAVVEGPPVYSSLRSSNVRVYEQVSPADTDGNEAGFGTSPYDVGALNHYGVAAPDGDAVLFQGTGALGESPWGASQWFVASREPSGWGTRAIAPRAQQTLGEVGGILGVKPDGVDPSEDLSHTLIEPGLETLAPGVSEYCSSPVSQLYLAGSDPFVAATWLEQPLIKSPESPVIDCHYYFGGVAAGGSPDFSVVYFAYPGTLLAEDASRTPHAGTGEAVEAWGFYEYREGRLREAGVLPDETLDPFGAVPAASGHGRSRVGNEVSESGERAFFVSPDPASCKEVGGQNECATDPPELYVREDGEKTVLVSKDVLSGGGPAPAGVAQMPNPTRQEGATPDGSYVFASADGSHAFFQSVDCLTEAALAGGVCGGGVKTYDFDVETGGLAYLPSVVGEILATNKTGSALAFVRPEGGGEPAELDLWSAGGVTPVTQLPQPSSIPEARLANDGEVLVFSTASSLSDSFNSGGFEEVYHYDAASNVLGCVSCAPAGVKPRGNAWFSDLYAGETFEHDEVVAGMRDERGVSGEGDEVFFDSPDPLVAGDTNTDSPELPLEEEALAPQGRDVYEWDDGVVSLISSGKSARNSFLLDNSENGDDVFFTTDEPLAAGADLDGGYVVYDARVPEPGEKLAAGGECAGSGCQGGSRSQAPVGPSGSASFVGLGNPSVEPTLGPVVKVKGAAEVRAEKLKKALKACKRDKKRPKRVACEKAARRKYGVVVKSSATVKSSTGKGR
jgi:hypothetical protein